MRIVSGGSETAVVNRDFEIAIPNGFAYETSLWDNDSDCAAAFVLFDPKPVADSLGNFEPDDDQDELFRLELVTKTTLDGTAEPSSASVKNVLSQVGDMLAESFESRYGSSFTRDTKLLQDTAEIKAGYSRIQSVINVMGQQFDITVYHILVATKWALYEGKATIMDNAVIEHQSIIESLLSSIKSVNMRSKDNNEENSTSFVTDVQYTKNQYYTLGELKLPVPDGMHYAAAEPDSSIPNGVSIPASEKKYAFIVAGSKITNPSIYKDSAFGYSVTKPQTFSAISWFTASLENIVGQLTDQLHQHHLETYGDDRHFTCLTAKRNFIVLWAPFKKSDDPETADTYWESIVFSVFTKNTGFHGTAFINGSAKQVEYNQLFNEFLNRLKPTFEGEVNEDGLENPLNLKNLIEAAGGTVVDWPGKNDIEPDEDTELEESLIEAIDEAANNMPSTLEHLADKILRINEQFANISTVDDAIGYIRKTVEEEKGFRIGDGDFFGPPSIAIMYEIPELLVQGEFGYYKRSLNLVTPVPTDVDGVSALKQIKQEMVEQLRSLDSESLRNMLINEAKRAKLHDDPLVSRRAHLLESLPVVFRIEGTDTNGRAQRIESVHVGDTLLLKPDYRNQDYKPVAIEVLNERKDSLGFLAGMRLPGFRDNALDDIAFLGDNVKAIVKDVTPLSHRRKGSKHALMDIEISAVEPAKKQCETSKSQSLDQVLNGGTLAGEREKRIREEAEAKKAEEERRINEFNRAREAELARRAEENRRAEEKKRREEAERKAQAEIEKYQQDMRTFAAELPQQLEAQLDVEAFEKANQFREQMQRLQMTLSEATEAIRKKATEDYNALMEKNKNDQSTLDSLGIFKLSEKKALKATISQQEEELRKLRILIDNPDGDSVASIRTSIAQAESNRNAYENGVKRKKEAIKSACETYRQRVEGFLQYRYSPDRNSIRLMSKMDENDLRIEEVASHLLEHGFFGSYDEIKMQDSYLTQHSRDVVSALSRLVSRGQAYKEKRYDGKYEYMSTGSVSDRTTVIDDRGWFIDNPPLIPTLENIQSYF